MKAKSSFWFSPTYKIIKAMQATGNGPGVIEQWVGQVAAWAEQYPGADSDAIKAWLPHWKMRPFYTAAELAPLFPALAVAMQFSDRLLAPKNPRRLYHELVYGKLPMLNQGATMRHPVTLAPNQYFIVERLHHWSKLTLTQQEFENVILQP